MDKPLKILHIIFSLQVGGMETMLIDIANTQAAAGHSVEILVVNDLIDPSLPPKVNPRVRLTMFHRREGSAPLLLMARLNMLVMRRRPDVIHAHHPKFAKLLTAFRSKLLVTIHDIRTPLQHCRGANMVAITDAVAEDIVSREPASNIEVIYNGILTDTVRRRSSRPAGSPFRIVQLARLFHEKKGQHILIKALGILKRRGVSDISVDFIGEGPSREYLQELAQNEGVDAQVHFCGLMDREEIYSRLAEYDAMVHPSIYEGFGLIVAEAMAAGLPLILTEYDGPWEVAARGLLCLSATRADAESFADAIEKMINNYPAALSRAERALEYVQGYDISQTVQNYISYYRRLISKS